MTLELCWLVGKVITAKQQPCLLLQWAWGSQGGHLRGGILRKLDNMLPTPIERHWPSGLLFWTGPFQGIFPVWMRGRQTGLIRICMFTAENKGVSKISTSSPKILQLSSHPGEEGFLTKRGTKICGPEISATEKALVLRTASSRANFNSCHCTKAGPDTRGGI